MFAAPTEQAALEGIFAPQSKLYHEDWQLAEVRNIPGSGEVAAEWRKVDQEMRLLPCPNPRPEPAAITWGCSDLFRGCRSKLLHWSAWGFIWHKGKIAVYPVGKSSPLQTFAIHSGCHATLLHQHCFGLGLKSLFHESIWIDGCNFGGCDSSYSAFLPTHNAGQCKNKCLMNIVPFTILTRVSHYTTINYITYLTLFRVLFNFNIEKSQVGWI